MKKLLIILAFLPIMVKAQISGHVTPKIILPTEYTCAYVFNERPDTLWTINVPINAPGSTVQALPLPHGQLLKVVGPLFNRFAATSNLDSFYICGYYNQTPTTWTLVPTDSTGASFPSNPIIQLAGMEDAGVMIRADSTLWYFGDDIPNIFGNGGNVNYRAFKLNNNKYQKVSIGYYGIAAVRSGGDSIDVWGNGGTGITSKAYAPGVGTGKWLDVSMGGVSVFSYSVWGIAQMTTGSIYGDPMVLGNHYAIWGAPGSGQSYTSFHDMKSQWGLTNEVAQILVNNSTVHVIDSVGNLYGTGSNVQGEVGIDTEFVNRSTYPAWPNYAWDFSADEDPVSGLRLVGTNFKHMYSNGFFTFYKYFTDVNDSIYVIGRCKSGVCGIGIVLVDGDQASNNANAYDKLVPTMVHPWYTPLKYVNWTQPAISAGSNQSISTSSTTLTATGHPAYLVNANSPFDTVAYSFVSTTWTCTIKPSGAPNPTFGNAGLMSTTVSNLTTAGTYTFQMFTVDNNQAQSTSTMTVTVSSSTTPPTVNSGPDQTIILPTSSTSVNGTATGNGGATITSTTWSCTSHPGALPTISSPNNLTTSISGLTTPGVYIFQLSATDNNNNTSVDTMTVTVDEIPTVNAGSNQTITLPTSTTTLSGTVTFYGGATGSSTWTCTVKPSGASNPTITPGGTSTAPTASVSGLTTVGIYTFKLSSTDSNNNTGTSTMTVTVNPAPCQCGYITSPIKVLFK